MTCSQPMPVRPGNFFLLETRHKKQTDMLLLAASFSQRTGAFILDGGNHFNAFAVVKTIRLETISLSNLDRLQVARAFNCHQLVTLSTQVPRDGRPCLLIDVLELFQDEGIPLSHRLYLIKKLLYQLGLICRQTSVFVSLTPPKESHAQWQTMSAIIRKASNHALEEGFMGKTLPTINQVIQQAEGVLARFSRLLQPEERGAIDWLFNDAKKHIAAISEANHLIPFEVAQQAMLLEQQKELFVLQKRISEIEDHFANK